MGCTGRAGPAAVAGQSPALGLNPPGAGLNLAWTAWGRDGRAEVGGHFDPQPGPAESAERTDKTSGQNVHKSIAEAFKFATVANPTRLPLKMRGGRGRVAR